MDFYNVVYSVLIAKDGVERLVSMTQKLWVEKFCFYETKRTSKTKTTQIKALEHEL